MPRDIRIDFDISGPLDIHRMHNFGEDLWKMARDAGTISCSLDEIDRATRTIFVRVKSANRLRREIAAIEKLLRRHGYFETVRVSVIEPEKS